MDYNSNKDREKRLAKTGKWFQESSKYSNKDLIITYSLPVILIIALCITVFIAIKG